MLLSAFQASLAPLLIYPCLANMIFAGTDKRSLTMAREEQRQQQQKAQRDDGDMIRT